jgi:hypothetical protein
MTTEEKNEFLDFIKDDDKKPSKDLPIQKEAVLNALFVEKKKEAPAKPAAQPTKAKPVPPEHQEFKKKFKALLEQALKDL